MSGDPVGTLARPALSLHLAQDDAADELLSRDPFALLVGMLLDQQISIEKAFTGPYELARRLGTECLEPARIAAIPSQDFARVMAAPPAVHRYHTSMGGRVQALAAHVAARYGGDAAAIWTQAASGSDLLARLRALPGFGEQKARIFVALLGKQCGVRPQGWQEAAGPYAADGFRSVADVRGPESLLAVRETKRAAKAAARAAARGEPGAG